MTTQETQKLTLELNLPVHTFDGEPFPLPAPKFVLGDAAYIKDDSDPRDWTKVEIIGIRIFKSLWNGRCGNSLMNRPFWEFFVQEFNYYSSRQETPLSESDLATLQEWEKAKHDYPSVWDYDPQLSWNNCLYTMLWDEFPEAELLEVGKEAARQFYSDNQTLKNFHEWLVANHEQALNFES